MPASKFMPSPYSERMNRARRYGKLEFAPSRAVVLDIRQSKAVKTRHTIVFQNSESTIKYSS
jgi:hypothetical protein